MLLFFLVSAKYRRERIDSIIPEFNQDFLNAEYKRDYIYPWWDVSDRNSRITAFEMTNECNIWASENFEV